MRSVFITTAIAVFLGIAGCSGPPPDVATAYNNQYGAVKTSRFTACPKVEGVWHLANLSAGSLQRDDSQMIQHFRWFAPYLFGLSVGAKSFIAVEPRQIETVVYLSNQMPTAGGRSMLGFTTLTDAYAPCIGHGWRRIATYDHSTNDAAARVLKLIPEQPKKIVQTDYMARTADYELLVATRIDYSGTDNADKTKKINDGYWHFIKMPRLHEDSKAHGFKS